MREVLAECVRQMAEQLASANEKIAENETSHQARGAFAAGEATVEIPAMPPTLPWWV